MNENSETKRRQRLTVVDHRGQDELVKISAPRRKRARGRNQSIFQIASCCAAPSSSGIETTQLVGVKSQATPSERVTDLLSPEDNGADPTVSFSTNIRAAFLAWIRLLSLPRQAWDRYQQTL